MNPYPGASNVTMLQLANGVILLDGESATAAAIAAELTIEPPVGTLYFSTGGKIFRHATAGTAAGNWLELTALDTAGVTNADLVKLHALTVSATDINRPKAAILLPVTVTLAEANAGKVLLPDAAGVTLTPVDFSVQVTGVWATGTSLDLTDTNGAAVNIASIAVAALTNGAFIRPNSANVTLGAGFLGPLTASKGIKAGVTGAAMTGGTKVKVTVWYTAA